MALAIGTRNYMNLPQTLMCLRVSLCKPCQSVKSQNRTKHFVSMGKSEFFHDADCRIHAAILNVVSFATHSGRNHLIHLCSKTSDAVKTEFFVRPCSFFFSPFNLNEE